MEEFIDMRDELEQDFGDDDETEEEEMKGLGMHVEGEEVDLPLVEEDKE